MLLHIFTVCFFYACELCNTAVALISMLSEEMRFFLQNIRFTCQLVCATQHFRKSSSSAIYFFYFFNISLLHGFFFVVAFVSKHLTPIVNLHQSFSSCEQLSIFFGRRWQEPFQICYVHHIAERNRHLFCKYYKRL